MSAEPDRTHQKPPFLKRVRIRNYKSIKFCDVELEPLTVLVGRNGSGKSNFVDALGFLRDVATWDLEQAVRLHGGVRSVHYRGSDDPRVEIEVTCAIPEDRELYASEVTYLQTFSHDFRGQVQYMSERVEMRDLSNRIVGGYAARFEGNVARIEWRIPSPQLPTTVTFNGAARSLLPVRSMDDNSGLYWPPLYRMSSYNFSPQTIRSPQVRQIGAALVSDGRNLGSVLETLRTENPALLERINQYLKAITGTTLLESVLDAGDYLLVNFRVHGGGRSFVFPAAAMSDGTLRAFAALVAVFQQTSQGPPSLVAIEEPETSLHPAATAALVDALDEATGRTQIFITTHSTELLDNPTIQPKNVRVVEMIDGETVITELDEASVEIVRERFDTLGGLERQNQLGTNFADRERQKRLAAEASHP